MRRWIVAVALLVLFTLAQRVFALATSEKGNKPLSEKNYKAWKGIMPVVNDKARVFTFWVNGSENLYYKGGTKQLNEALAHFARVDAKHHVVVLRPGPAAAPSFDKAVIHYNWELHIIGGIASRFANNNPDDLDWQRWPVLTISVGAGIDLKKLNVPKEITLKSAAGRTDEAEKNAAAKKQIADLLKKHREAKKPVPVEP